jgi:deazaflavin-dependent oxidoreductase (nitroreductase family)
MSPSSSDFNASIIEEFRANRGRVGGHFEGTPVLLLHHTGARSGASRVNPLVYLPDDGGYVVFASKAGAPTHPHWYHNLRAQPNIKIEVETDTIDVTASEASGEERDRLFGAQVERQPQFAEHQSKTDRVIRATPRTIPARSSARAPGRGAVAATRRGRGDAARSRRRGAGGPVLRKAGQCGPSQHAPAALVRCPRVLGEPEDGRAGRDQERDGHEQGVVGGAYERRRPVAGAEVVEQLGAGRRIPDRYATVEPDGEHACIVSTRGPWSRSFLVWMAMLDEPIEVLGPPELAEAASGLVARLGAAS